jgi:putative endonuclease
MGILSSKPKAAVAKLATTKQVGDCAEELALRYLQMQGLRLLVRNYRTPGRGGGEIDLIMHAPDGTTVFVEVRKRSSLSHGGAAASVGGVKQRRIVFAARHYLMRLQTLPPCRFDVVVVEPEGVQWLQAAFDAQ